MYLVFSRQTKGICTIILILNDKIKQSSKNLKCKKYEKYFGVIFLRNGYGYLKNLKAIVKKICLAIKEFEIA